MMWQMSSRLALPMMWWCLELVSAAVQPSKPPASERRPSFQIGSGRRRQRHPKTPQVPKSLTNS